MALALSPDQSAAVLALFAQLKIARHAILVGAAGTGKTTTMTAFVDDFRDSWHRELGLGPEPVCVCPTWKAALRFAEVTGWTTTSIHKLIYGPPTEKWVQGKTELEFGTLSNNDVTRRLIIVDECSMIGQKVYADLVQFAKKQNAKILFVGDKAQLEPVNDTWGVDFDHPTAELTQVHRQKDGHLLDFVTGLRTGELGSNFGQYAPEVNWVQRPQESLLHDFWQAEKPGESQIVLTFTNRLRIGQNNVARRALGLSGFSLPQAGEPIMSYANRANLVNGEIVRVIDYSQPTTPEGQTLAQALRGIDLSVLEYKVDNGLSPILLIPQMFGSQKKADDWRDIVSFIVSEAGGDITLYHRRMSLRSGASRRSQMLYKAYESLAEVDFGYACTAHKSQGSQWDRVCVMLEPALNRVEGGVDFRRRWLYTACTRAVKSLTVAKM